MGNDQMTRGALLRFARTLDSGTVPLTAKRGKVGNAIVKLDGPPVVVLHGCVTLDVTGEDDQRPVPDGYAHLVAAALRASVGIPAPDLYDVMREVLDGADSIEAGGP